MIALTTISELVGKINALDLQSKVLETLKTFLPKIIEKSGVRNVDEILDFAIESSYEILPLPIRMLIKRDAYVSTLIENKQKAAAMIAAALIKE